MNNEYTRKEKICPLIGKFCDKKNKNCNICILEEEEWNEKTCGDEYDRKL